MRIRELADAVARGHFKGVDPRYARHATRSTPRRHGTSIRIKLLHTVQTGIGHIDLTIPAECDAGRAPELVRSSPNSPNDERRENRDRTDWIGGLRFEAADDNLKPAVASVLHRIAVSLGNDHPPGPVYCQAGNFVHMHTVARDLVDHAGNRPVGSLTTDPARKDADQAVR